MDLPFGRAFRLTPRGSDGLSCDQRGVALGRVTLVRVSEEGKLRRSETRSAAELGEILGMAYGAQRGEVVQRFHRGLKRVAARLEASDLAGAQIEAVMIGFPDLATGVMEKLSHLADLEKAGGAWVTEPRVPAGQTDGGQWTAGDAGLGDGVYRPERDHSAPIPTGNSEDADEGFRQGIGGNEPPWDDLMTLEGVFPGLKEHPGIAVPLAPVDAFLGVSSLANEANLQATEAACRHVVGQIRAVDPTWRDNTFYPAGGLAGFSWQGRAAVIRYLLVERAVVYYKIRGDIRPLQVETLRFLQNAVDEAYEDAVRQYGSGNLPVRLSQQEAIGNLIDARVRAELKRFLRSNSVNFGPGQTVTVNNRDPSSPSQTYRIPDARLGRVSFDWSLALKTISAPQIRGFFQADSEPEAVIIVRPRQLGRDATYLIPRPSRLTRRGTPQMPRSYSAYVPETHSELLDELGAMILSSPTFLDRTGYFPEKNIDTEFKALHDGMNANRHRLGEERFRRLTEMSGVVRKLFEADPNDETGDSLKGREVILDMIDLIKAQPRTP